MPVRMIPFTVRQASQTCGHTHDFPSYMPIFREDLHDDGSISSMSQEENVQGRI